ncbi:hypothetical protein ACFE04_027113 [Oxalis oulophora]
MEVEKKRSKGGFLNFFDWNGKSRKKLFAIANNSELSEGSKQGEENQSVENKTKSQLQMIETESRSSSSNKESSDFNCASSITSDEEYVSKKAPGVVARLMGLESMPTSSNLSESCSTSYFDLCSIRASQSNRSNPNLLDKYQTIDYPSFSSKLENFSWNNESRSTNVQTRPMERFQTEVLPPRSAKPISITHHKLLSPIKSPGFFPSRDASYIIEAAAKIIEASPQPTMKNKMPSVVSSQVPLRIRDLKERMEAAHKASRPHRSNEPVKGQTGNKNLNKSAFKGSTSSEKNSPECLRNKGKLVSQANLTVQKREGSSSSSNTTSARKQTGKRDVKLNPLHKTQPDMQRNGQKGIPPNKSNNVLRQNNQKQNNIPNKDSSISGPSISNQRYKKAKAINGSNETARTVKKVVVLSDTDSRKNGFIEKKPSSSKRRDSAQNELPTEKNLHFGEKKDLKSLSGNIKADGPVKYDADSRKKGMDIVSFTFTSPIKKSGPSPQPHGDVMAGDSLSVILEQKLRELTSKIESSHFNIVKEGNSTNSEATFQDLLDKHNVDSTNKMEGNRISQFGADEDKSESLREFDCSSTDDPGSVNSKWQPSEGLEAHSISNGGIGAEFDCRNCSPVSILETSSMSEGCSDMKSNGHGSQQYLAEAQICGGWLQTNDSTTGEYETEFSDTASSISFSSRHANKMSGTMDYEDSNKWELNNVKMIIVNAELMLEEFALGQTDKVITPNSIDHIENQENGDDDEKSKLSQKLLFDCVNESLESRCGQLFVGSRKTWDKCRASFQYKGRLAEEVYREIVGWRNMGDMMVDELVDNDMSTQCGRWVDFDLEGFEEGAYIENGILTSLVDELVSDLI